MRTNFGFHHLLPFRPRMWHELRDAALAQVDMSRKLEIHCSDIDQRVIRQARDNAKRAGVATSFRVSDIVDVRPPNVPLPSDNESGTPIVIVNPEFGIRLGDERQLRDVYRTIGDVFKQNFQGYTGYVFTGNFRLAKEVGLRSSRRMTFWSADLECRLLEFELYSGTKKQYARTEGDQEG
jgi:putative N6-adenine-specific DNA methylase